MRRFLQIVLALLAAVPAVAENVVLVGGTVIDGTGRPGFAGNVRIRDGRIAEVGSFQPARGEATINVAGMIVAPGFIDLHNHSADELLERPEGLSQIMQGITTALLGPDGTGPIGIENFMAVFDENPAALNVAALVGHSTVRVRVMGGNYKREATPEEIGRMVELVEDAMREGAFGLSSGLEYDPGFYGATEEIVALAAVAGRYGGIYVTHIRSEGERVMEAIAEAIDVGRRAQAPVQISHLKLASAGVRGKAAEALALIDRARAQGADVAVDVHPYEAWSSNITVLVASREFDNPEAVGKSLEEVGGAGSVMITRYDRNPEYNLKTLEEIAREQNRTPVDIYMEIVSDGGAAIVCSSLAEDDVRAFLKHDWAMVSSDSGAGMLHPSGAGAFPRVLGRIVRDEKVLTLEAAIRKMTGLPASRLGLNERGVLRRGAHADVAVFDPNQIQDLATLQEPSTLATGMKHVFVNGTMVVKDGQPTGELPGLALR